MITSAATTTTTTMTAMEPAAASAAQRRRRAASLDTPRTDDGGDDDDDDDADHADAADDDGDLHLWSRKQKEDASSEKVAEAAEVDPVLASLRENRTLPHLTRPDDYAPVESYVTAALNAKLRSSDFSPDSQADVMARLRSTLRGYNAVLDVLRNHRIVIETGRGKTHKDGPAMLYKILVALGDDANVGLFTLSSSSGGGGEGRTTTSKIFALLLHLIFKLDPFPPAPPSSPEDEDDDETPAPPQALRPQAAGGRRPPPRRPKFVPYVDDYRVADAQLHLVCGVVSMNTSYVQPALEMFVKMINGHPDAPPERILRIHAAMSTVLRRVPSAAKSILPSVLADGFPFKNSPVSNHVWYVRQLLSSGDGGGGDKGVGGSGLGLLDYAPSTIAPRVLELCVERCLLIDVEIRISDGGTVTVEDTTGDEEKDGGGGDNDNDDGGHGDDGVFDMEMEDRGVGVVVAPVTPTVNRKEEEEARRAKERDTKVDELAEKLDSTIVLLFQHIRNSCTTVSQTSQMYHCLLPTFEDFIFPTYKCKFVQFLIFYVCGRHHELSSTPASDADENAEDEEALYRMFASSFLCKILDSSLALVHRQTSACYLASYISRAKCVDAQTVCECVAVLLRWAEMHLQKQCGRRSGAISPKGVDRALTSGKLSLDSLFYSVCQAAFYVMCFRGADAWMHYSGVMARLSNQHIDGSKGGVAAEEHLNDDPTLIDIGPHRWYAICSHPMNPLKYCLESVRREFLHLAGVMHLLPPEFVDKLQRFYSSFPSKNSPAKDASTSNKRRTPTAIRTPATLAIRRTGGVGGLGQGSNPLDSFFPFDPYLLRNSHVFVDPYYRSWEGGIEVTGIDAEDLNEDDDGDIEDASSISAASQVDSEDECSENANGNSDGDGDDDSVSEESHHHMDMPDSGNDVMNGAIPMSLASTPGNESLLHQLGESHKCVMGGSETKLHCSRQEDSASAWEEEIQRYRKASIDGGSW